MNFERKKKGKKILFLVDKCGGKGTLEGENFLLQSIFFPPETRRKEKEKQ